MSIFNNLKLMSAIRGQYLLDLDDGIHGIRHWTAVRENGLKLAATTRARVDVVELFSVLHDSCRRSDGSDPEHGPRAVELARLFRGAHFKIDDQGMSMLVEAIHDHTLGYTLGKTESSVTVMTCWDADRLDLPRVGISVDPARLCTDAARQMLVGDDGSKLREAIRDGNLWEDTTDFKYRN